MKTDLILKLGRIVARLDGGGTDDEASVERLRQLVKIARQKILELEARVAALEAKVP